MVAKWSKNVKVRTFGETNPKNTKWLQTKFKLMLNFYFADRLPLQKSTQTGDETEPKGAPKLAKKTPSEVEGRP